MAFSQVSILPPFSSVHWLVMPNYLQPHGQQHARRPCRSPTPVYSNSCPLRWWCRLIISTSVGPFSSCLQSFPASGSFQMDQFFTPGGQRIRVSASASVLSMNIQDLFPLGRTSPSTRSSSPKSCQINFSKPAINSCPLKIKSKSSLKAEQGWIFFPSQSDRFSHKVAHHLF